MPKHYCDRDDCKFCEDKTCTATAYHVDRYCVTFRKRPRSENYRKLMAAPFNANCCKTSSGYKSNSTTKVLK